MANTTGKKFGGRKKGTPNKSSRQVKEILADRDIDLVNDLIDLLPELEPEDQANVLLKLMKFVYPELKSIAATLSGDKDKPMVVTFPSDEDRLKAIQRIRKARGLDK